MPREGPVLLPNCFLGWCQRLRTGEICKESTKSLALRAEVPERLSRCKIALQWAVQVWYICF